MSPARAIAIPSEAELIELEAYLDNVEDGIDYRASRIKGPTSGEWTIAEEHKRNRNVKRGNVAATARRLIELARQQGAKS